MKRFVSVMLALILALSLASGVALAEDRHITMALWWDLYYDSDDTSWEDSPSAVGKDSDIMRFENVKLIEDTYGVTFEFVNATYAGVQDSINNSILAGEPDFDLYMTELGWGVPAVVNGLATDLRSVLDPDDPFLSHDDVVLNYIDLPDGSASLITVKGAEDQVQSTYPLAFNLQMLQEANLEDPRELVEKGEWTWDKFREYCQVLTKDTDKTAYPIPEENGHDVCRYLYRDKKVAFTSAAAWIMANYDDYNWDGKAETTLDFDMVFVDYPIGPSGNAETNSTKIAAGSFWMLPAGVEDPKLVFNVFRAYQNWYHDDVTLRDDPEELEWWYTTTSDKLDLQDWNFEIMRKMGEKQMVDFVNVVLNDLPLLQFLNGEYTPAQFQETYRQTVQDALDQVFGG